MATIKVSRIPESDYNSNEAYKTLRTNISFCGADKKVILTTSCLPDEGKSTVSMNLAISIADSGKKVLFIDADLRNSVIVTKNVIKKAGKGFSHVLSGQCEIEEAINNTTVEGLDLIISGPFPPNPAELLQSDLFKQTISNLREIYDFIIIDAPPIGRVIDAAVIAGCCDGIILVINSGKIEYRLAQQMIKQMELSGTKVLGAVLNNVNIKKSKYYGKYYGSYGSYGNN